MRAPLIPPAPSASILVLGGDHGAYTSPLTRARRLEQGPGGRMVSFNPDASPEANQFYADVLTLAKKTRRPFLIGGSYAINAYTGQNRGTKDVDIFCRAGDCMRLLQAAQQAGFETEVEDDRWIAKIKRPPHFCDVIFGSANMIAPVNDLWFQESVPTRILEVDVNLLPPTELIWSKAFIMDRQKFDGSDVAHVILKEHQRIDWRRLLAHFELHWEVLLVHIILFRYIYPTERTLIPEAVLDELLERVRLQRQMPIPQKKPCRGRVFSRDDYQVDIMEWGFADLIGDDKTR